MRDPRAEVLYKSAWLLAEETGEQSSLDLAKEVERVAVQVLLDEKPGRNLNTNVEFYTALLLRDVVGLSYTEIADSLEITLATVKWRIYKAREEVQLALAREGITFGENEETVAASGASLNAAV